MTSNGEVSVAQEVIGLLTESRSRGEAGRQEMIRSLSTLNGDAVKDALAGLIGHAEDPEIQYRAVGALVELDPEQGIPLAIPLLESPDSTMRWVVCGLLSDHGDQRAVVPLSKRLAEDPEPDVRLLAAFALGRIGDGCAIPALEGALDDDGMDFEGRRVCDGAAEAIKKIRRRSSPSNASTGERREI